MLCYRRFRQRDALVDELNSVLAADDLVDGSLGAERCLAWSQQLRLPADRLAELPYAFEANIGTQVDGWVLSGGAGRNNKKRATWATKLFAEPDVAYASDLLLAELLQARRHYSSRPPMLTLGVVLQEVSSEGGSDDNAYYVCVQPLCDSVRLKEGSPRQFPLLPLRVASDTRPRFVAMDGDLPTPFKAAIKLHRARLVEFETNHPDSGVVRAEPVDGSWLYRALDGTNLRHLGQLRDATIQRIAHDLGSDASRIGVDDPEWIRLGREATGPARMTGPTLDSSLPPPETPDD